jgi:hypothetical protein
MAASDTIISPILVVRAAGNGSSGRAGGRNAAALTVVTSLSVREALKITVALQRADIPALST